jgi:signal transduction histidine kinase
VSLRFRDQPIGTKLMGIALLASTTALVSAGLVLAVHEERYFRRSLIRRLHVHAEIIGFNSAAALLFRDESAATNTLGALRASGDVRGGALYDESGRLFAIFAAPGSGFTAPGTLLARGRSERFESEALVVEDPIVFEDRHVGTILLRASLEEMHRQRREFAATFAFVAVAGLGLAVLISRRYQRAISRPVQSLAAAARRVSEERDYGVRAQAEGRDEVGLLVEAFNEMLSQIQARDRQLEESMEGLERRVEERTRELTAVNREIEAFSYSVSHDLRAPLRHISGFADLLRKHGQAVLDEKGLRYLGVIGDGARRMGCLIDDLLAFSRTSRTEMREQRVDLAPLARDVIAEIMRDADGRQVEWTVGALPAVTGDPALLRVVLMNLLSNAFKYTNGRAVAHVEMGVDGADGGLTTVFVRDDGVGFDMRFADKLFGVFQRLHSAQEFEGTGIGLATVERIVQRHGGRVWAESSPDAGATFFFTLRAAEEQE